MPRGDITAKTQSQSLGGDMLLLGDINCFPQSRGGGGGRIKEKQNLSIKSE